MRCSFIDLISLPCLSATSQPIEVSAALHAVATASLLFKHHNDTLLKLQKHLLRLCY